MANTIGTGTLASSSRAKYASAKLQQVLRNAQVAEAVCNVDRSDVRYIHNPYSGQATAAIHSGLQGTYSVSTFTVTDDTLTVGDEFVYSEHIYDFERWNNNFDLRSARMDEMAYAISWAIDDYVINNLCEDATGTYTAPAGWATSGAGIAEMIASLNSKVLGYEKEYLGRFLILENSQTIGLMQFQMAAGYSYADAALNNGLIGKIGGVDIYVVRDGAFKDTTGTGGAYGTYSGSDTWTNDGHLVYGVKGIVTYAAPRGIQYEEKGVTGKTGKEIVCYGYCGFKVWAQVAGLLVDITA